MRQTDAKGQANGYFNRLVPSAFAILSVAFVGCVDQKGTVVIDSPSALNLATGEAENATGQNELANSLRQFTCLDGRKVSPFSDEQTKAVVLVFISTDCPIANALIPCLKEMAANYSGKGVKFFFVHSTIDTTQSSARTHAEAYGIAIPIVLDEDQTLAKAVDAKVTPEAFVIVRGQASAAYRGAINNLYVDYGKKRRAATEHFLRKALDDVLAGNPPGQPETKPIGCFITFTGD